MSIVVFKLGAQPVDFGGALIQPLFTAINDKRGPVDMLCEPTRKV